MTKQDIEQAIYQGELVNCTKKEYENEVRHFIQEYAGKCIDTGDNLRAMIALNEVERLDRKFEISLI